MPTLRSSTIAARRQRIVTCENGGVNGIPFVLWSGLPSRRTRGIAGALTRPSGPRLQPADELADVLVISDPEPDKDQLANFGLVRRFERRRSSRALLSSGHARECLSAVTVRG